MNLRRKAITLIVLACSLLVVQLCFHLFPGLLPAYHQYIFSPFQQLRGWVFGYLPFSIGEVLYAAALVWAVVTLIGWVVCLIRFKDRKAKLAESMLKAMNTVLALYLLFFLGWAPITLNRHCAKAGVLAQMALVLYRSKGQARLK
jgi:hypothetical protein